MACSNRLRCRRRAEAAVNDNDDDDESEKISGRFMAEILGCTSTDEPGNTHSTAQMTGELRAFIIYFLSRP